MVCIAQSLADGRVITLARGRKDVEVNARASVHAVWAVRVADALLGLATVLRRRRGEQKEERRLH